MDYKQFVRDLYSMATFLLIKQGESASKVLFEVMHDLGGVVREERCFSPRCSGYEETVNILFNEEG